VPEADVPLVTPGARATIQVPALGRQEFEGKVSRIAPALDPETRTARAEIDLPNPESRLPPGMFVRGSLAVERRDATPPPAESTKTLLQARLEVAQKGYGDAVKLYQQGKRVENTALPLTNADQVHAWSQRWLDAQREASEKKADRVAAVEAHLERMKQLEKM